MPSLKGREIPPRSYASHNRQSGVGQDFREPDDGVQRCAQLVRHVVARELRLTKQTVGSWHSRFLAARLGGLLDEPRPGAPRKIGDGEVDRVVTLTLESTPRDATHWSTRAMATRCDLRLTRLALG